MFLALDLSKRRTGWAYWDGKAAKPIYGHWVLGSEYTSKGETYAKLYRCLRDHVSLSPVEFCYVEQPIQHAQLKGHTNIDSLQILAGIVEHVHSFAYFNGWKPVREINVSSWRRHFVGSQKRGTKRDTWKRLAMERCAHFGWTPRYDDEADALGLLDYGISQPSHGITPPWRMENVLSAPLQANLIAGGQKALPSPSGDAK